VTQLVEIAEVLVTKVYWVVGFSIFLQGRGWTTVDGIEVLGLQLLEQWRLWLGPDVPLPVDNAGQKMRGLASGNADLNGSSMVGFYEKKL
jgi:hypothetical protein